ASFAITTTAVSTFVSSDISATYGSSSFTTPLSIEPPGIASVTLNPTTVEGGAQNSTGTVTITSAAPVGGLDVALSSSDPAASVPATVTVAAGQTTAIFVVTTSLVAATTTSDIKAGDATSFQTATLTITPPAVTNLSLNPTTVEGGAQNSTGTVTIRNAAP